MKNNFLTKLITIFFEIIFIPFWFVISVFPRKLNHIVLGELMGEAIGENSTFLSDQLSVVKPNLKIVHIVNTEELCIEHRKQGRECYKKWSFKGIIATLRAKIIITSNSKRDVNKYFVNGATLINLWHGSPIKKIMCDDEIHPPRTSNLINFLFPYRCGYNYDYNLCSGKSFVKPIISAFHSSSKNLLLASSPKCTAQYSAKNLRDLDKLLPYTKKFLVLYAPTFRDYDINFDPFLDINLEKLDRELRNLNAVIVVKSHFASQKNSYGLENIVEYSNLFGDTQVNLTFNSIDALITDYSGIYFDFLLTKKPLILAPVDYDKYLSNGRKLYFDYFNFPCDFILNDWGQLIDRIADLQVKTNSVSKYTDGIENYLTYKDQPLAELIVKRFCS